MRHRNDTGAFIYLPTDKKFISVYKEFKEFYLENILKDELESELKNLTRPLSQCDQFKYSPSCKKSGLCLSTFDKSVPVILAPEVCPIVYNNIPRRLTPGYHLPDPNPCKYVY